jgi:4-oxalomesaconate hydratase
VSNEQRILVIAAHAADFCIRAGGVIARYVQGGAKARVIVLSPGARGESNELWAQRKGQITEEEVAEVRLAELDAASKIIGVEWVCYGLPDQPLQIDRAIMQKLMEEIRTFRPTVLLTHPLNEPYNWDHGTAGRAAIEVAYYSQLAGVHPSTAVMTPIQTFFFEPTQPMAEATGFNPDTFIDITDVMDVKMKATAEFKVQPYHVERYRERAVARAKQAAYVTGDKSIQYAEAYERYIPWVGKLFP